MLINRVLVMMKSSLGGGVSCRVFPHVTGTTSPSKRHNFLHSCLNTLFCQPFRAKGRICALLDLAPVSHTEARVQGCASSPSNGSTSGVHSDRGLSISRQSDAIVHFIYAVFWKCERITSFTFI
jgi:hypothetical protein